jgi:iron-sulfur cluster insertion protein
LPRRESNNINPRAVSERETREEKDSRRATLLEAPVISFSDTAVAKVKEFAAQTPEAEGKELRIFIQGVGCSGFAYGFTFDEERDGDTKVESGGLTVLVDPSSAPHLTGSKVDFVDDQRGTGFMVENPNQPPADACGTGGGCSSCG